MNQGRNENIKYKGYTFHVQTEDRGSKRGIIVSTLFYRGLIITEERITYDDRLSSDKVEEGKGTIIRELHGKVIENLKKGVYDEKIKKLLNLEEPSEVDKDNPLRRFFLKQFIPSLKRELKIELGPEELELITSEVESIRGGLDKNNYLHICSFIYQLVKQRCSKDEFKRFIKGYAFQEDIDKPDRAFNLRDIFQRIVFEDLVEAIGFTLSAALIEKVFSEVHPSFLKKKEAFDVIMKRILNSGVVQKRTTSGWITEKESQWREKYNNLIRNLQGYV